MDSNSRNHLNYLRAVIKTESPGSEQMLATLYEVLGFYNRSGTVLANNGQDYTIGDWITAAENHLIHSGISPLKYRFHGSGPRVCKHVPPLDAVAQQLTLVEQTAEAAATPVTESTRVRAKHSHYHKDVRGLDFIDVYRVLQLFNVTDPCVQHAVKKLLVAGGRGAGKDISKDIQEAIDSLVRWQEMQKEARRD